MVPQSDHPLVECLEALHRVLVGVFGQILYPELENHISTFEETFMGTMRTHNPRLTPKVHVFVHHVPEYGVQPEFNSGHLLSRCRRVSIDVLMFPSIDSK